jgi:2,3-bisphosphoglycerate-dependent phosphoglycerate mutase
MFDPHYAHVDQRELPSTESLKDTLERVLPYWHEVILPSLMEGNRIIISAHGNSLRALVKYLDNVSDADIPMLNIPTGVPLVYEFDDKFRAKTHYYLGDKEDIERATESVAGQIS